MVFTKFRILHDLSKMQQNFLLWSKNSMLKMLRNFRSIFRHFRNQNCQKAFESVLCSFTASNSSDLMFDLPKNNEFLVFILNFCIGKDETCNTLFFRFCIWSQGAFEKLDSIYGKQGTYK